MSQQKITFTNETEQEIFEYFSQEHNVILMQSDFWELENIINKDKNNFVITTAQLNSKNFTKDEIDDLQEGGIN